MNVSSLDGVKVTAIGFADEISTSPGENYYEEIYAPSHIYSSVGSEKTSKNKFFFKSTSCLNSLSKFFKRNLKVIIFVGIIASCLILAGVSFGILVIVVLIGDYDSVQIEYYDSSTKKIIKVPKLSHSGRIVLTLKYLSNGYVASSTDDSNVNVWDPKTWSSKHLYKGHTSAIWCMDQIDEDTIVSGSDDGTIHIWKIRTGLTLKRIPVGRRVFTVKSILNSFQIACGLYDSNDLRIYNYSSGDLVQTLNGHTNWVLSVEALNQQYIASGDANNFVFIWDLETHSIRYKLTEHSGWVYCLKLLSSSLLASADAEGLIIIWNWLQGTLVHKLQGHNNAVHFSSLDLYDNQTLISGSWDSTIKLWNISNGSLIETITTDIEINTLTILKGNN